MVRLVELLRMFVTFVVQVEQSDLQAVRMWAGARVRRSIRGAALPERRVEPGARLPEPDVGGVATGPCADIRRRARAPQSRRGVVAAREMSRNASLSRATDSCSANGAGDLPESSSSWPPAARQLLMTIEKA